MQDTGAAPFWAGGYRFCGTIRRKPHYEAATIPGGLAGGTGKTGEDEGRVSDGAKVDGRIGVALSVGWFLCRSILQHGHGDGKLRKKL